jgi:hypothetical protein
VGEEVETKEEAEEGTGEADRHHHHRNLTTTTREPQTTRKPRTRAGGELDPGDLGEGEGNREPKALH